MELSGGGYLSGLSVGVFAPWVHLAEASSHFSPRKLYTHGRTARLVRAYFFPTRDPFSKTDRHPISLAVLLSDDVHLREKVVVGYSKVIGY